MEKRTAVAVDLAKSVFEIAVSEIPGEVSRGERLPRSKFLACFEAMPPAVVVMEACGSATYWGRRIQALGHHVALLPPHQVRPYVTRNKTDRTDARGILEAYRNKDNSSRSHQDGRAAGARTAASVPLGLDFGSDRPGEYPPWAASGVWRDDSGWNREGAARSPAAH